MKRTKTYTNSLYYHIRMTARYLKLFGCQLFEKMNLPLSFDEFIALDVISCNEGICQRDLAKLLLKDRANTGRLAEILANKELIEINIDTKNKRLVKKLSTTEKGQKAIEAILLTLEPTLEKLKSKNNDECEEKVIAYLTKCRETLSKIVDTQI
ncbi:MAG: hypothetical protein PHV37_05420 [Candidatus Gastranaerophilales bacterium]|nr:hypothetical protein [Candidatus Gastranaerophilales bacterium]